MADDSSLLDAPRTHISDVFAPIKKKEEPEPETTPAPTEQDKIQGYTVGQSLFYAGANVNFPDGDRLVFGQAGTVLGPAHPDSPVAGKGFMVKFDGNSATTDVPFIFLSTDVPKEEGNRIMKSFNWVADVAERAFSRQSAPTPEEVEEQERKGHVWRVLHIANARSGAEKSTEFVGQFRPGARVQELERVGERVHVVKVSGDGPAKGWVSEVIADGTAVMQKEEAQLMAVVNSGKDTPRTPRRDADQQSPKPNDERDQVSVCATQVALAPEKSPDSQQLQPQELTSGDFSEANVAHRACKMNEPITAKSLQIMMLLEDKQCSEFVHAAVTQLAREVSEDIVSGTTWKWTQSASGRRQVTV